jgi:hypothetical protein
MIRSPVQDLYLSPSQLCLIKLESVSGSSRPSDGRVCHGVSQRSRPGPYNCVCVFIQVTAAPQAITKLFRGGSVEDMCYERRRAARGLGSDGFWIGDYGRGVRVRRPFGTRRRSPVRGLVR